MLAKAQQIGFNSAVQWDSRMSARFVTTLALLSTLLSATNSANAQAPASVAGDGFLAGISNGTFPFGSYGYYLFLLANTGNSYQIIDIYNVANSSGTYSYSATGPATSKLNFNDSLAGIGTNTAT